MNLTTIIFWILVILFVIPSLYFGFIKLTAQPAKIEQFSRWGFPMWFMQGLGLTEIIAAIAIVFQQSRIWGISIWAIILVGAVAVNLKNKEPRSEIIIALVVSIQLLFIYLLAYRFNAVG